mgnify:CR=1 FL=1
MRKKILIIEDDTEILSIFEMILEEEGYELLLRQSGLSVEEATIFNPDLILLDVRIEGYPKLGTEICKEFKASKMLAKVPMLLISSENNLDLLAAGCHADGFLSKPFDVTRLVNKVKEFIN